MWGHTLFTNEILRDVKQAIHFNVKVRQLKIPIPHNFWQDNDDIFVCGHWVNNNYGKLVTATTGKSIMSLICWQDFNLPWACWQTCCTPLHCLDPKTRQAWELRMEKSAEKWGSGGRRRPLVGVRGRSWSFVTKIRRKNCIKQPCIFQFCQFLTWCKTITFWFERTVLFLGRTFFFSSGNQRPIPMPDTRGAAAQVLRAWNC